MKLHCTLVRGPKSNLRTPPLELTIKAREGASGADIHGHLVRKFGVGAVHISGKDLRLLVVGEAPLTNGAVLVDGDSRQGARKLQKRTPANDDGLALAVHSGSGAGTVVPLQRGSYTIGRGAADIVIPDSTLSRKHVRLIVSETNIVMVDLDSANGVHVDGKRVRNSVITTDSSIRCGNTSMSLVFMVLPASTLADAGSSAQEPLTIAGRADTGSKGTLLLTAVLPLLLGIAMAVITGMWMFLAFTAVSAVSMLLPLSAGRRHRQAFEASVRAAVAKDTERRRRAGPSLALLVLAAQQRERVLSASPDEGRVWLRLGEARQPPNIRIEPAAELTGIPSANVVPVCLDPDQPVTVFRGRQEVTAGAIRSLVMQLAGYPRSRCTRVVIFGPASGLPLAARYLPAVTLTASLDHLLRVLESGCGPGYRHGVILATGSSSTEARGRVLDAATRNGWQVLLFTADAGKTGTCDVQLSERESCLRVAGGVLAFVPDLATGEVFDKFCRNAAAAPPYQRNKEADAVPRTCSLGDVLALSRVKTADRWKSGAQQVGLRVPLGLGSTGTQFLDLEADGPHLLVAGTTGSGKSELLRSLTLALALCYPPSMVNFLFVDFKGGSGLGPLANLTHSVGLLTDLSAGGLDRTLQSLRAEVRLREETLASARVPDLNAYRSTEAAHDFPLPHLVIVIDEFRMLVDHAPVALRELLRIAAIGRSLGIHLVMATQRPQGAVTADIRANVTTNIALRVQSEIESTDIINARNAAHIGLATPGRAFLARGSEAAQEFQTASLGNLNPTPKHADCIDVELASDHLASLADCPAEGAVPPEGTPAQTAAPLVAMVQDLWRMQDGAAPRQPVAPCLPLKLPLPPLTTSAVSSGNGRNTGWSVQLGLVDLPAMQSIAPLLWFPAEHSHIAAVGGTASGAHEALELVTVQVLHNPVTAHVYVLDALGTFEGAGTHPRVGAHVHIHELQRAARVLQRLKQELTRRLARGTCSGQVALVLVVSGWGSWVSAFRAGPLAWAEDVLQDLLRDGKRAGLAVIASGDRELASSRTFPEFTNRLFFPAGSTAESRASWPRMHAAAQLADRAVAFGNVVAGGGPAECQLYSFNSGSSWVSLHTDQSGQTYQGWPGDPENPADRIAGPDASGPSPFRIEALPLSVPASAIGLRAAVKQNARPLALRTLQEDPAVRLGFPDLCIGLGGDELEPMLCRLQAGTVLTVLGGAGSGKTNLLRALPLMNPLSGPWLTPREGADARNFWEQTVSDSAAGGIARGAVALVDNVHLLPPETVEVLSELNRLGHPVVLTADCSALLVQRVPLVMSSRVTGTGLLLSPRSLSDGDLFGVRFDVEADPPPGRGVLISGGLVRNVQVGLAGAPPNHSHAFDDGESSGTERNHRAAPPRDAVTMSKAQQHG